MGLKIIGLELEKLKAEKRLTAYKCSVDGCEKIGLWVNKDFYLKKDMCDIHYKKQKKYGDPLAGKFNDGRTNHLLYHTWYSIRDRITNEKDPDYPNYGGRGLKIEQSWISDITGFWQFLKDIECLGDKPNGYSLDRKDNNLGYLIGNLRWATRHQQQSNQRTNNKTVGVYWHKQNKKWCAKLFVNKIRVLSAFFDTYEDAVKSRKDAEIEFNINFD